MSHAKKTDNLSPDRLPPLDEVNKDVFTDETSDIFNFIKSEFDKIASGESELSLAERSLHFPRAIALARTREKFVNSADFAELANLADIIISAPQAKIIQEGLNVINARLQDLRIKKDRGGVLTEQETEERKQLRADRKLEVAKILPFNHKLRDLIDTVADVVSRKEIEDTIERAMGNGSGGTAQKIVAGMGAEVAVARVARTMFGPENVRLSTQQEEPQAIDIVVSIHGRQAPVDVKTGGNIDDAHKNSNEVAIEKKQIEDFSVIADQLQDIRQKLQDATREPI